MMKQRVIAVGIPLLSLLAVYLLIRFLVIPMMSPPPDHLGMGEDMRLADCPHNNNCVSSFARMSDFAHYIVPLKFGGSVDEARQYVAELLAGYLFVTVLTSEGNYIHAEYRSTFLGFINDLELYFDESAGLIHVRSASRFSGNDFGANRQQVETLRQDLAIQLGWEQ